jgi:hypothetical protein
MMYDADLFRAATEIQSAILRPITERLMWSAMISPGMRVLGVFFGSRVATTKLILRNASRRWHRSPLYAWTAETLQSVLPQLAKIGITPGHLSGVETLESNLRTAVLKNRSQVVAPGQVCAWAGI